MYFIVILITLLRALVATALHIGPRLPNPGVVVGATIKEHAAGTEKIQVDARDSPGQEPFHPTNRISQRQAPDSVPLKISLVNNFDDAYVKAYISGSDSTGKVFFISRHGKLIYPGSDKPGVPREITKDITLLLSPREQSFDVSLPPFIRSGRVYFADSHLRFFVIDRGEGDSVVQPSVTNLKDPNVDVRWGFVELTYMNKSLYANISYVDFVGVALGMMLTEQDGTTQTTAGLVVDAVAKICKELAKKGESDNHDWPSLCVRNQEGKPVRVLSPGNRHGVDPRPFGNYWDSYVEDVWNKYTSEDLVIDTQMSTGLVKCRVSGNNMLCEGIDQGFAKPTSEDIWGCNSGPFAISEGDSPTRIAVVPRICAAFIRSTLLLDGGNVQPRLGQTSYYTVNPTNHYSRIVHSLEDDGRGYAFPYDDVNPHGVEDASGVVSSDNAKLLTVYVGGRPAHS